MQLLLLIYLICISFGIIYDSLRLFSFFLFNHLDYWIDRYGFVVKVFSTLISFSVMMRITFKFRELSGNEVKYANFMRGFYVIALLSLSFLNAITFYPQIYFELGLYVYMVDPMLLYVIYPLYSLLLLFLVITGKEIFKYIRNNKIRKKLIILSSIVASLLIGRLLALGLIQSFHSIVLTFLVNYVLVSIILSFFCIFILKYPDFIEEISTYFNVKAIYLIEEKGTLLYQFNFQQESSQEPITSNQILLGGFIRAINQGLRKYLDIKGIINAINIGNFNLLFKQGKHIYGTLLTTDFTPKTHEKLEKFVMKFEDAYGASLESWKGELDFYKPEILKTWINEIFG